MPIKWTAPEVGIYYVPYMYVVATMHSAFLYRLYISGSTQLPVMSGALVW